MATEIKFEGVTYNAEGITGPKGYKNAKAFIKHSKHQHFVGDPEQEAKMSRVYELCKAAVNGTPEPVEPAPINPGEGGAE